MLFSSEKGTLVLKSHVLSKLPWTSLVHLHQKRRCGRQREFYSFSYSRKNLLRNGFLDTQLSHVRYNLHEPGYNLHEPGYNLHEPGYNLHEPGYNPHEEGYNLHEHVRHTFGFPFYQRFWTATERPQRLVTFETFDQSDEAK